jgi:hypothetical protein
MAFDGVQHDQVVDLTGPFRAQPPGQTARPRTPGAGFASIAVALPSAATAAAPFAITMVRTRAGWRNEMVAFCGPAFALCVLAEWLHPLPAAAWHNIAIVSALVLALAVVSSWLRFGSGSPRPWPDGASPGPPPVSVEQRLRKRLPAFIAEAGALVLFAKAPSELVAVFVVTWLTAPAGAVIGRYLEAVLADGRSGGPIYYATMAPEHCRTPTGQALLRARFGRPSALAATGGPAGFTAPTSGEPAKPTPPIFRRSAASTPPPGPR